MRKTIYTLTALILTTCSEQTLPKPKAYLSLNYPEQNYSNLKVNRPYVFMIAHNTQLVELPKNWLKIQYPELKASIDITYRPIDNNLTELFLEAEKLVFEHTIKADFISWRSFNNDDYKVFGKMCTIEGNAASQMQFHATDSTKHFIKASLFFYAKPNYDSIYPAVKYIEKDMVKMLESLKWKND
ncbi:MAG: gliding motility lipoprotein GldD [Tenacibaculum sp.]